jgi:DNA-binding transcriptional regulator YhcF (GntR family)
VDLRVDREAEVPLGTQLAWKLRRLIETGELDPGDRLPSVRDAAAAAGVNVNTVRAVYGRLEGDGLVSSEQGRGTFVRAPAATEDRGELDARRALRRQIARLEAELALRPPPATETGEQRRAAGAGGALLSAEQLEDVRDGLLTRLRELEDARAEVMRRLDELPVSEEPVREARPSRSSASLSGARVRWVGA